MKLAAAIVASTVASAQAAPGSWDPAGTPTPALLNPVIAANQTNICYGPWDSFMMGTRAYSHNCSTVPHPTNTSAPKLQTTPIAGPDCMFYSTGNMGKNAVFWTLGAEAAADAACCYALIDLSSVVMDIGGGWIVNKCMADGNSGNCGNATAGEKSSIEFWSKTPGGEQAPFAPGPVTYWHNTLPSEEAFIKASKKAFSANGGKCWLDAKAHFQANFLANPSYPDMLKGIMAGLMIPYMDKRMNLDMNPRTTHVAVTNQEQFCFSATEKGAMGSALQEPTKTCQSDSIKVPAPNCVHLLNADKSLFFVWGPEAGQLPGCCMGLLTMSHMYGSYDMTKGTHKNWVNDGCDAFVGGMPSCMEANKTSTKPYWMPPSYEIPAGQTEFENPEAFWGTHPSEEAFDAALDAVGGNDAACWNAASNFTASNGEWGYNAMAGGFLAGIQEVLQHYGKFPTTTTTPPPTTEPPVTNPPSNTEPSATATKKVVSAFTASETLPASVTPAQLFASTTYKATKKAGLATALQVNANDITILSFTISARRALLENRQLSTASKTVTTNFEVAAADASVASAIETKLKDSSTAAAIKTAVVAAISAADWSGEAVLSTAPVVTAVSAVQAPVVSSVAASGSGSGSGSGSAKKTSGAVEQFSMAGLLVGLVAMLF